MSESKENSVVDGTQDQTASQPKEEKFVSKKAYEEVTSDMHKFKSKAKEVQAKLNEYEAKIKSIEEEKLKEQNRWKELYEKEQQERVRAEESRQKDKELYLESVKLSALKNELGGDIRNEYLRFADLTSISIDDSGSLSSESVKEVANKFRHEHPSLIPSKADANITSAPAAGKTNFNQEPKDLSQMSTAEKMEALAKLRNQ